MKILAVGEQVLLMDSGRIIASGDLMELCLHQPLLTQAHGCSSLLQGTVSDVNEQYHTCRITLGKQSVLLSGQYQVGAQVRCLVRAQDVSLSLSHSDDSSIQNILPVVIKRIEPLPVDENHASVELAGKKQDVQQAIAQYKLYCQLDDDVLIALLSAHSVQQLQLREGQALYAQFKATALASAAS